jgi:ABC-type uncharacterized transport system auxiliary subunit
MRAFLVAGLMAVVLAGCLTSGEVTPTRRYTVEPIIEIAQMEALSKTVGIRPLEGARPYREAMVYLGDGEELGQRVKEEWAERPQEVLTRAITDALAAAGRFADVGDAANMARPDYILTGEVRQFREDRTTTPWSGEIEVSLALREAIGVEQVWSATLRVTIPMEDETATSAARALSEAVAKIAIDAAQGIAAAVR